MRQGWYVLASCSARVSEVDADIYFADGFVIVTQTCDLDREAPVLQVAAVCVLNEDEIAKYGSGRSPRYFHINQHFYADLSRIWTVERSSLNEASLIPASLDFEGAVRGAVSRRFGRLAIPTHVGDSLRKLRNYILEKNKNPASEPYLMLQLVSEIRVSIAPDWSESADKDELTLTLVLEDDELTYDAEWQPTHGTEAVEKTIAGMRSKQNSKLVLNGLSGLLSTSPKGTPERDLVWQAIARSFGDLIASSVSGAVPVISECIVQVTTKSQYTLTEFENSERLDLAHLSQADVELDDDED
jgi:hypothetical protein